MSWNAANVRTAVAELLEGTIGTYRTVAALAFSRGVWTGQPAITAVSLANQAATARNWFDVELGALGFDSTGHPYGLANKDILRMGVTVRVWTSMVTTNQRTQRDTDMGTLLDDLADAARALGYPGNLRVTATAGATNLVGGCLVGPAGQGSTPATAIVREDGDALVIISEIRGLGYVSVEQQ